MRRKLLRWWRTDFGRHFSATIAAPSAGAAAEGTTTRGKACWASHLTGGRAEKGVAVGRGQCCGALYYPRVTRTWKGNGTQLPPARFEEGGNCRCFDGVSLLHAAVCLAGAHGPALYAPMPMPARQRPWPRSGVRGRVVRWLWGGSSTELARFLRGKPRSGRSAVASYLCPIPSSGYGLQAHLPSCHMQPCFCARRENNNGAIALAHDGLGRECLLLLRGTRQFAPHVAQLVAAVHSTVRPALAWRGGGQNRLFATK